MRRKQAIIRRELTLKMKGAFPLLIIPILILSVGCAVNSGSNRSQNFLQDVNSTSGKAEVAGGEEGGLKSSNEVSECLQDRDVTNDYSLPIEELGKQIAELRRDVINDYSLPPKIAEKTEREIHGIKSHGNDGPTLQNGHKVKERSQEWTEIESKYFKNREYIIQNGDLISVSVFKNAEFSDQMKVRDDGRISLPTLGDVKAAGLTMKELESVVVKRLSKRLKDSEVTVALREEKPKLIYLLGEVKTEGPFLLNQCPTPLQGIIKAGGFTPVADKKKVLLLREFQDGNLKVIKIDMAPTKVHFYKKRQDLKLQPNDIIIIPMSTIGKVNRWMDQYVTKTIGAILSIPSFVIQLLILDELLED